MIQKHEKRLDLLEASRRGDLQRVVGQKLERKIEEVEGEAEVVRMAYLLAYHCKRADDFGKRYLWIGRARDRRKVAELRLFIAEV